jgi:hypothetical protein
MTSEGTVIAWVCPACDEIPPVRTRSEAADHLASYGAPEAGPVELGVEPQYADELRRLYGQGD